jgi:hypothetical protein
VASYQISCAHGQCDDPDCGSDYVVVGDMQIDAAPLIELAEADILQLWTMHDGEPVSVVVGTAADGRKTLKPKARSG